MASVTLKFFDFKPSFEKFLKDNFDKTTFPIQNSKGISQVKVEMETCNIYDLPEYVSPEKHPQTAFVSPANSFGWMNGGIDYPLSAKVLPGIEKILQEMLTKLNYHGELEKGYSKNFMEHMLDSIKTACLIDPKLNAKVTKLLLEEDPKRDQSGVMDCVTHEFIEKHFPRKTPDFHLPVGSAILVHHPEKDQFLISAPTMFFPQDVRGTRNAYYAMIAILKVVEKHNTANPQKPITKILCPGLCTGVGGLSFAELSKQVHDAVLDFQKGTKDPDDLDMNLVNQFEQIHPGLLYLRESAYHQAPLKMSMLSYTMKSMFGAGENSQLLEDQFEATSY